MPKAYESIKRSVRKSNPKLPTAEVKRIAAQTYIGQGDTATERSRRAKALARDRR